MKKILTKYQKYFILFTLSIIIFVTIIGCGGSKKTIQKKDNYAVFNNNTRLLSKDIQILMDENDDSKIRLIGDDLNNIKRGNIIISDNPPMAKKVVDIIEIKPKGTMNEKLFITEKVSLPEIFDEASIKLKKVFKPEEFKIIPVNGVNIIPIQSSKQIYSDLFSYTINFDKFSIPVELNNGSKVDIKLKGSAKLSLELDFDYKQSFYLKPQYFRCIPKVKLSGTANLKIEKKIEKKIKKIKIGEISSIPIPTGIPFVAVVVEGDLYMNIKLSLEGNLDFAVEFKASQQLGMEWGETWNKPKVIKNFKFEIEPSVKSNVAAKAKVVLLGTSLSVKVNSILGPYVAIENYIDSSIAMIKDHVYGDLSMKYNFSTGVECKIGLRAELLKWEKNWEFPGTIGMKWPIPGWPKTYPIDGEAIINIH